MIGEILSGRFAIEFSDDLMALSMSVCVCEELNVVVLAFVNFAY